MLSEINQPRIISIRSSRAESGCAKADPIRELHSQPAFSCVGADGLSQAVSHTEVGMRAVPAAPRPIRPRSMSVIAILSPTIVCASGSAMLRSRKIKLAKVQTSSTTKAHFTAGKRQS